LRDRALRSPYLRVGRCDFSVPARLVAAASVRPSFLGGLLRFSVNSDLHHLSRASGSPGGIRLPMCRPSFANFVACFPLAIDFKNERPRLEARILNIDFAKMEILRNVGHRSISTCVGQ
jgi:hypothetical protein